MTVENFETKVVLARNGDERYIGITPPLTVDETRAMEMAEIIDRSTLIINHDEFEPPCSLLSLDFEHKSASAQLKIERTEEVAIKIAYALKISRTGEVLQQLAPISLARHNGSPFNPKVPRIAKRHYTKRSC